MAAFGDPICSICYANRVQMYDCTPEGGPKEHWDEVLRECQLRRASAWGVVVES